ncbi:MAG: FtsQ-type POTRA domain-containing protein [Ignavibacteriae bacterium]|nr:FtsQ-type POTRA domain-containing protein [Ignavibacteriota bacterium]MCB9217556.1 FtsQ-type POTRA domain-containing protein [Ignavibacteria bacterium]
MKKRKTRSRKLTKKERMARAESRRFASKVSLGIILIGAAVGLVAVANKWIARERLESIIVKGNLVLDTAEILKQAALPDSVRVKAVDLEEVEERLSAHPFIAHANAWEGGSGSLVLEVEERAPVAVTIIKGEPIYLDAAATPLPFRFGVAAPDVPVLQGVASADGIDSVKVMEAIEVATIVREYSDLLYQRVAEVHRGGDGLYSFTLTESGVPVLVGTKDEILPRLPKLEIFLAEVLSRRGSGQLRQIDLRWNDQVVVKWKGGGKLPDDTKEL